MNTPRSCVQDRAMSKLTESSDNGTPTSAYYKRANDAANRGEFEYAKELCHNAVKQFEDVGEERKASEAYHLLGEIAYRQGDLKNAESWYREALAIDERTGDESGSARTYNNLGALANARGEYDTAEEWLWKSIHIKERLADEDGLAASYLQLGIVAETRLDFDAAEKWYLRSHNTEEKLNDEIGVATACLNLCGIAEKQGNNDSADNWRQKALQAVGREGHASAAINLGRKIEQQCEYEDARMLYRKALDIAKEHGDDNGLSLSYLYLGHLACEMGNFTSARERYKKSIEIDERIHATERAARSCFSLGNICLAKVYDGKRDVRAAKKWFKKSFQLKQDTSRLDSLRVYAHLWYYRVLSVLSK